MKTKVGALIGALIILLTLALPAAAQSIPATRQQPRLVDNAALLTEDEADALLETLDEISERQQLDVVVVTVNSLGGKSPNAFADDFFDYNGFGFGTSHDGILLLLDMGSHKWAISTTGFAITAFTDAGQEFMVEEFKPDLSDGLYADAFQTFARQCDEFVTQARTGEAFDNGNLPHRPLSAMWIFISLVIGAAIAFIATGVMRSKLKSVRSQAAANSYVRPGSLNITRSHDLFLYRHVTRVAKPKENTSSGSSTHVGSSGSTHGDSSGSF